MGNNLCNNTNTNTICTENKSTQTDFNPLCVICMENEVTTIIFPCSHYCVCQKCAEQLKLQAKGGYGRAKHIRVTMKDKSISCPVCRSFGFLFKVFI